MANPNVLFSRGSSATFQTLPKDPNTLYFLNDTHELYLGSDKYGFGNGLTVVVSGVGDTVSNVSYDSASNQLAISLGDAADASSIQALLDEAIATCVKTISSDNDSAIIVDDSDPENIEIGIKFATNQHAGNVQLGQCSDGMFANVDIPEASVQSVDPSDKILALDGTQLHTELSVTTERQNDVLYIVLKGINGVEVSKFDATDFVKAGLLKSVSLEYATDGSNDRVLVLVFNVEGGGTETIKVNVQDLVDIYTAGSGIKLIDGQFSIDNEVEASGPINSDVSPAFGDVITLKAVKFDSNGLITGTGNFNFTMPTIVGGEFGGAGKLLSRVVLSGSGQLEGDVLDISTELSASATDGQIPTAKAVWSAIEDAKSVWERF